MLALDTLSLKIDAPWISPSASNFRPPSWPPPPDWTPIIDRNGKPVCKYADSIWSLRCWSSGPRTLNFGDGVHKSRTSRIDPANADLLRLMIVWRIWGPRGARTVGSIRNFYDPLRTVVSLCSEEGILASDLMRFPAVVDKISTRITPSRFAFAITAFHDIYDARDALGFTILDRSAISRLAKNGTTHKTIQTPYVPPRIWTYQVNRLRAFLDDFTNHKEQIESCFSFVCDSYAHNYGSLEAAFSEKNLGVNCPFQDPNITGITGRKSGKAIHGPFALTEDHFGLSELFDRWLGKDCGGRKLGVVRLSRYLTLTSLVGLKYILNFSLMRIQEAWGLRSDCLIVESDEKLGDIYLIRGETTKTDTDSDARWPTSPSVQHAVNAMTTVSRLRMRCAQQNPLLDLSADEVSNPYLLGPAHEPWSNDGGRGKANKQHRQSYHSYSIYINKFPHLLDKDELVIKEEDLKIARLISPDLDDERFSVGKVWPLAFHQLRRTGAVNMLSSGLVSEPSLQHLLKHVERAMTMYYGHNYAKLNLDPETRTIYIRTMYEALSRVLVQLQNPRFISPHGESRKESLLAFISESDANQLENAGRKGEVSARRIRLGFCMKRKQCTYGGVESVAHCGGGISEKPCADVLYDRDVVDKVDRYKSNISQQIKSLPSTSPRRRALLAEERSLDNYYATIKRSIR